MGVATKLNQHNRIHCHGHGQAGHVGPGIQRHVAGGRTTAARRALLRRATAAREGARESQEAAGAALYHTQVELAAARVELAHVREQITGMQNQSAVDIGVGTRLQYEVDELRRQTGQHADAHTRQLEARDEVAAQLARTVGMEKEAVTRELEAARRAAEQQIASLHAATELLQQQLTAEQQAPPATELRCVYTALRIH